MPTYQYACTECERRLEAVQSFTDDALTECPTCHGRLRKLYSAVGIVFKGSGFYRTDSRSGGDGGSEKSTSTTTSGSAEKTSTSASSSTESSSSSAPSTSAPASTSSSSTAKAATAA